MDGRQRVGGDDGGSAFSVYFAIDSSVMYCTLQYTRETFDYNSIEPAIQNDAKK
jgi:hypothetical protein